MKSKIEQTIYKAITEIENGKTIMEILDLLKTDKSSEAKDVAIILRSLEKEKQQINAPKDVLHKILESLRTEHSPVTNSVSARLLSKEATKGQFEFKNLINNMTKKWQILFPMGMATLALLLIFSGQILNQPNSKTVLVSDIAKDEQTLNSFSEDFDSLLKEEKMLGEIDSALLETLN